MTEKKNAVSTTLSNSDNPVDPTIPSDQNTPEKILAAKLIAALDDFQALVPNFEPRDAANSHKVASAARFAKDLIPPVIGAVEGYQPSSGGINFDADAAKEVLAFGDAMVLVRQRLDFVRDGFNYTVDRHMAGGGLQALQFYTWAKSHAKGMNGVGLRPYLPIMKRQITKIQGRHRKSAGPAAPTPPPAGAHALLAANLGKKAEGDHVAEQFDRALEEAAKD